VINIELVTDTQWPYHGDMGPLQELARDLGAEERTLRRAALQGTLRAHRPGPRRLRLASGEREYLRTHWQLLSQLRGALRTERRVRLAVLYGSLARGEEDPGSDIDLLVSFAADRPAASTPLAARVEHLTNRRVDIAHLTRVEADAPLLLECALDDGRVLVDRDGQWPQLRERRRAIRARAHRANHRQMAAATAAIEGLTR
jgi:predicted nucleotidyltransferase